MWNIALSIVQVVSGALVAPVVRILAESKAGEPFVPTPGVMYAAPFPNCSIEFMLVFFGLVIATCGYLQRRKQIKFAGAQIILGLIITITFTALGIREATLDYSDHSYLYYYAYLLIIPVFAVSLLGIAQLILSIKGRIR